MSGGGPVSVDVQAANPFILADAEKALCKCANHATNVWADGNRGHYPSCPAHPRNLPRSLTHCCACDIPFSVPLYGPDPAAEYACEGICNV